MSEVTLSRRLTHYLALFGLMFFFVSCVCCDRQGPVSVPFDERYAACRQGVNNPNSPVACVDVVTLAVSPEPIKVFDRDSRDRTQTKANQVVWIASDGKSDLRIEATKGCVENMFCNKTGVCRAQTVDVGTEPVRCKYTVRIGERTYDPVVITVPCCMLAEDTEMSVPVQ